MIISSGAHFQDLPLLKPKLHIPPVRPELVPRPRLIERLNAGLSRKLTLLSAPAGFGKTTLLSEWVHKGTMIADEASVSLQVAWLSLDAEDDDPTHFWAYLVAALQRIDAGLAQGADRLFHAAQPESPSAQASLVPLLNEIAALPLSTRVDPPLPVVRLRARGQLTELRTDDLRFTLDEAAAFLNRTMGVDLSLADVDSPS